MPQECANCPRCHKSGLPIVLTRYAVALKYNEDLAGLDRENPEMVKNNPEAQARYGKGILPASGNFEATDKEGNKAPHLGEGTQYTLRLLRSGYVYVYNKDDPLDELRCYEVSNNGLITETTPNTPRCGCPNERYDVACAPDKNLMTAGILTIRNADKVKEVWIGYSDTKWTPAVARLHEDREYRKRHMRRIDVAAWMGGNYQQKHTANIHEIDSKKAIIAEYVPGMVKEAFSFSTSKFNGKDTGLKISLKKTAEELNKGKDEKSKFPIPPRDEDIMALTMWSGSKLTAEQRARIAATPFERLVEEFDRFYDRAHSCTRQNTQYKGKGMILALDDPAGILMDLDGLIEQRRTLFVNQKEIKRGLRATGYIGAIQGSVIENITKEAAKEYKEEIEKVYRESGIAIIHWETGESVLTGSDLEKMNEIKSGQEATVKKKYEDEWMKKYIPKLADNQPRAFQDKYEAAFKNFRKTYIDTLAEAHAKWMESDRTWQYFDCNYDSGDSIEAREQSASYVDLFARCVGSTDLLESCRDLYVKWLSTKSLDEKNLLWQSINVHSKLQAKESIDATGNIEAMAKALAPLARDMERKVENGENTLNEELAAAKIIRERLYNWFNFSQLMTKRNLQAFAIDSSGKLKDLEQAQKKLKEAVEVSKEISKSLVKVRDDISKTDGKIAAVDEKLKTAKASYHHKIEVAARLDFTKHAHRVHKLFAELDAISAASSVDGTPLGGLINHFKSSFAHAQKLIHSGAVPSSEVFKHFETVINAQNNRIPIQSFIEGYPMDVVRMQTPRSLKGSRAIGRQLKAFSDKQSMRYAVKAAVEDALAFNAFSLSSLHPDEKANLLKLLSGGFTTEARQTMVVGSNNVFFFQKGWFYSLSGRQDVSKREAKILKRKLQLSNELDMVNDSMRANNEKLRRALSDSATRDWNKNIAPLNIERQSLTSSRAGLEAEASRLSDKRAQIEAEVKSVNAEHSRIKSDYITVEHRSGVRAGFIEGFDKVMRPLTVLMAGFHLWVTMDTLDKMGEKARAPGVDDVAYKEAYSTYVGSVFCAVGIGAEASIRSYKAIARNFKWAPFLRVSPVVSKLLGAATAPITFIEAYWDGTRAMKAYHNRESGWALGYGLCSFFGLATGVLSLFVIIGYTPLAPVAIICALIYAVAAGIVAYFSPNEMQRFLKECFLGKFPSMNSEYEEIQFKRLGINLAPQK